MQITVSIVEDNRQVRQSLAVILNRSPGVTCLAHYASAEEALGDIPQQPPQVLLMDLNLPGMNGVECVRRLSQLAPATQILILTVYKDHDSIFNSLAAGACGYLLKPVRASELISAVKDVYGGGAPMSSNIARKVIQTFKQSPQAPTGTEMLSEREQQALQYLSEGYLYKEIAERMQVSYATVRTYVERIYQKLHVCSRAQAVAKLFKG